MVKLSKRLAAIADKVPAGVRLADIGSDHALLPVALVQAGKIRAAVAGEINDGPLQAAAKQVREAGLQSMIDVRQGDGLAVLSAGEVDVIVIAGMGGALIAHILDEGQAKLAGVRRLILQPNVGAELVRRWLLQHDWALTEEAIVEEDDKIYEICVAERMDGAARYNAELYRDRLLGCTASEAGARTGDGVKVDRELLLLLGPHLLDHPDPAWFRKWREELEKLETVHRQISLSTSESAASKRAEIERQMESIREVLECLPMDRRSSS